MWAGKYCGANIQDHLARLERQWAEIEAQHQQTMASFPRRASSVRNTAIHSNHSRLADDLHSFYHQDDLGSYGSHGLGGLGPPQKKNIRDTPSSTVMSSSGSADAVGVGASINSLARSSHASSEAPISTPGHGERSMQARHHLPWQSPAVDHQSAGLRPAAHRTARSSDDPYSPRAPGRQVTRWHSERIRGTAGRPYPSRWVQQGQEMASPSPGGYLKAHVGLGAGLDLKGDLDCHPHRFEDIVQPDQVDSDPSLWLSPMQSHPGRGQETAGPLEMIVFPPSPMCVDHHAPLPGTAPGHSPSELSVTHSELVLQGSFQVFSLGPAVPMDDGLMGLQAIGRGFIEECDSDGEVESLPRLETDTIRVPEDHGGCESARANSRDTDPNSGAGHGEGRQAGTEVPGGQHGEDEFNDVRDISVIRRRDGFGDKIDSHEDEVSSAFSCDEDASNENDVFNTIMLPVPPTRPGATACWNVRQGGVKGATLVAHTYSTPEPKEAEHVSSYSAGGACLGTGEDNVLCGSPTDNSPSEVVGGTAYPTGDVSTAEDPKAAKKNLEGGGLGSIGKRWNERCEEVPEGMEKGHLGHLLSSLGSELQEVTTYSRIVEAAEEVEWGETAAACVLSDLEEVEEVEKEFKGPGAGFARPWTGMSPGPPKHSEPYDLSLTSSLVLHDMDIDASRLKTTSGVREETQETRDSTHELVGPHNLEVSHGTKNNSEECASMPSRLHQPAFTGIVLQDKGLAGHPVQRIQSCTELATCPDSTSLRILAPDLALLTLKKKVQAMRRSSSETSSPWGPQRRPTSGYNAPGKEVWQQVVTLLGRGFGCAGDKGVQGATKSAEEQQPSAGNRETDDTADSHETQPVPSCVLSGGPHCNPTPEQVASAKDTVQEVERLAKSAYLQLQVPGKEVTSGGGFSLVHEPHKEAAEDSSSVAVGPPCLQQQEVSVSNLVASIAQSGQLLVGPKIDPAGCWVGGDAAASGSPLGSNVCGPHPPSTGTPCVHTDFVNPDCTQPGGESGEALSLIHENDSPHGISPAPHKGYGEVVGKAKTGREISPNTPAAAAGGLERSEPAGDKGQEVKLLSGLSIEFTRTSAPPAAPAPTSRRHPFARGLAYNPHHLTRDVMARKQGPTQRNRNLPREGGMSRASLVKVVASRRLLIHLGGDHPECAHEVVAADLIDKNRSSPGETRPWGDAQPANPVQGQHGNDNQRSPSGPTYCSTYRLCHDCHHNTRPGHRAYCAPAGGRDEDVDPEETPLSNPEIPVPPLIIAWGHSLQTLEGPRPGITAIVPPLDPGASIGPAPGDKRISSSQSAALQKLKRGLVQRHQTVLAQAALASGRETTSSSIAVPGWLNVDPAGFLASQQVARSKTSRTLPIPGLSQSSIPPSLTDLRHPQQPGHVAAGGGCPNRLQTDMPGTHPLGSMIREHQGVSVGGVLNHNPPGSRAPHVAPKTFPRQKSQVVPRNKVDWSHVQPRTTCRLDAAYIPPKKYKGAKLKSAGGMSSPGGQHKHETKQWKSSGSAPSLGYEVHRMSSTYHQPKKPKIICSGSREGAPRTSLGCPWGTLLQAEGGAELSSCQHSRWAPPSMGGPLSGGAPSLSPLDDLLEHVNHLISEFDTMYMK